MSIPADSVAARGAARVAARRLACGQIGTLVVGAARMAWLLALGIGPDDSGVLQPPHTTIATAIAAVAAIHDNCCRCCYLLMSILQLLHSYSLIFIDVR